jgi:hypothetical protein
LAAELNSALAGAISEGGNHYPEIAKFVIRSDWRPGPHAIKRLRDLKATSPVRYLRSARYVRVREALSRAEPEQSVTEIALRWGFTHMGGFSVEYRKRFGESPSETLRRRKITVAFSERPPETAPSAALTLC